MPHASEPERASASGATVVGRPGTAGVRGPEARTSAGSHSLAERNGNHLARRGARSGTRPATSTPRTRPAATRMETTAPIARKIQPIWLPGTSPDDERPHGRERRDGDEVHRGGDCVSSGRVSLSPGPGLDADAQDRQRQRSAGERDRDGPHRPAQPGGRSSAHRLASGTRSHSETWAGCRVSVTTALSSVVSAPEST